jgi:DNA sulfur modification protein DndC
LENIEDLKAEIRELYKDDEVPWIIGYSGGKDSTAIVQLIWLAISELPEDERHKDVNVISTDTLVENPVVAEWVTRSLDNMRATAERDKMPFVPHRLMPTVEDTFWTNLIGKGYPSPRHTMRWCTSRLKISPSNTFINNTVKKNGEAILVLGTRKTESTARNEA